MTKIETAGPLHRRIVELEAEVVRLNKKCSALAYLHYGRADRTPEDPLQAEIERLRKLLDGRTFVTGDHEPSEDSRDAARYRWLRSDNAYAPEESMVRGGEQLDKLCDDGIAERT